MQNHEKCGTCYSFRMYPIPSAPEEPLWNGGCSGNDCGAGLGSTGKCQSSAPAPPPPKNEQIIEPPAPQTPRKWCNLESREWFLIQSIALTMLNIPVIIVLTPLFGLSVFPFTYILILLIAAIGRKILALQTIKVIAWILYTLGRINLIFLPIFVASGFAATSSDFPAGVASGISTVFFIAIFLIIVYSQLYLVSDVLKTEKEKKFRDSLRNVGLVV